MLPRPDDSKGTFRFLSQAATRPGATGGHTGAVPTQMTACAPPNKNCAPLHKRGLCPEEINRLGATAEQIEAQIGVCHRHFRNFCGLTPDFMTFLGRRSFFSKITCFRPEKPLEVLILAGKFLSISVKTFFVFVF